MFNSHTYVLTFSNIFFSSIRIWDFLFFFIKDTGLRNIIDKLAEFVARNGPEFETITKAKQQSNPRFSFLFGGEFYQYYQWRVSAEQAGERNETGKKTLFSVKFEIESVNIWLFCIQF